MLRPDGVYVLNIIDYPPLRFARAELRTLQEHFEHVAVLAPSVRARRLSTAATWCSSRRIVRSTRQRCGRGRARTGVQLVDGDAAIRRLVDGMPVITDDHAPVDQWLSRDRH